ncbi:hypothetical protein LZ30DRAFT_460809 [Colletotrichum cereale]|nr:hypothetical protein LZ30DRAFT_460809 [Colletotrichum cereale]
MTVWRPVQLNCRRYVILWYTVCAVPTADTVIAPMVLQRACLHLDQAFMPGSAVRMFRPVTWGNHLWCHGEPRHARQSARSGGGFLRHPGLP